MAVANSTEFTPDAYLEQTSSGQTLVDVAGDITLVLWIVNNNPAVVLPAYKTPLILLTDTDLSSPYLALNIVQADGQQQLQLQTDSLSTTPALTGIGYRAVAIRLVNSTHLVELYMRSVDGDWTLGGSLTQDFSGTPFVTMRALADGIASVPDLGVTFVRGWNALLTAVEFETEVTSAVAVRTNDLVFDTPLQIGDDLTDVSGNDNDWSNQPAATDVPPTPWALGPSWAEAPTGTFTYTNTGLTPVGDTLVSNSTGNPFTADNHYHITFTLAVTGVPTFNFGFNSSPFAPEPFPVTLPGAKFGTAIALTGPGDGLEVTVTNGGGMGDTIVISAVTITDVTNIGGETYFPVPPTFANTDAFYPVNGQFLAWRIQPASALRDFRIDVTSGNVVGMCGGRGPDTAGGRTYFLADDFNTGFTSIITPEAVIPTTRHFGSTGGGYHTVMELPSGELSGVDTFYPDLLTVDRDAHVLVRISTNPARGANPIRQIYGLSVSVFDAQVNSDGTRLIYVDGTDLKLWDLSLDVSLGTILSTSDNLFWPVWLSDCTVIVSLGGFGTDAVARRYSLITGALLQTYVYQVIPSSPFAAGQIGIAADTALDRVYIVGNWNGGSQTNQLGVLIFQLSTSGQLGPLVPLIGNSNGQSGRMVGQPFLSILCTPMPPPPPEPETFPVRRYMRFMLPWPQTNQYQFLSRIEVILQAGIGHLSGVLANPIVMMRLSRDGGKTYGTEMQMSVGTSGDYSHRAYLTRLGRGRNFVVELTVSDSVNWQIVSVLADLEEGTS